MNDSGSIHPLRPESQASSAPTPLFANDADSFVQQLRLAAQAHRAGRLDEAISSYMRLLTVRPYHAELHNNLGVALRLVGKLEASISHHRLSLAADPENPALHSNLGNALRAANRLDEAVKHHFRSIALNRDYAEGFFNLALCLRDLGRLDEAVGCFGLTEPDFGSNPAGMLTNAKRDGNEWVLNGEKTWITNGSIADVAVVWAQTDEGIRGFVVPTSTKGFCFFAPPK